MIDNSQMRVMAQCEKALEMIEDSIPAFLAKQVYREGNVLIPQLELFYEFRRDVPVLRQRTPAPPSREAAPQDFKIGRLHCPDGMDRASLESAAKHLDLTVIQPSTDQNKGVIVHTLYVWAPKSYINSDMIWEGSECLLVFEDSEIPSESETDSTSVTQHE